MDDLTRNIEDEVPWCILFGYIVVLIDETKRLLTPGYNIGGKLESRKITHNRPRLLYGAQCWETKKQHILKFVWGSVGAM